MSCRCRQAPLYTKPQHVTKTRGCGRYDTAGDTIEKQKAHDYRRRKNRCTTTVPSVDTLSQAQDWEMSGKKLFWNARFESVPVHVMNEEIMHSAPK